MEPKYYGAAAEYNKPAGGPFNSRLILIVGGVLGLIILLMVGATIFSAISSGPQRDMAKLVAREGVLQELVQDNRDRIKSGDLKKVNADANLLLLSDVTTLDGLLSTVFKLEAVPKEIEASEKDTSSEEELKEAEQLGRFDRTYIGVLRDKITSCLSLAQSVMNATNNQSAKDALKQNIDNLQAIDDQLAALK